jgi:hypothetical protein
MNCRDAEMTAEMRKSAYDVGHLLLGRLLPARNHDAWRLRLQRFFWALKRSCSPRRSYRWRNIGELT